MHALALVAGILVTALMTTGTAQAATFVYVSNAEDGTIGMYTLGADGALQPGPRVDAGKPVMPMSVSPDKRFLFAAIRSKPFTVVSYSIDRPPARSSSSLPGHSPRASRTSRSTTPASSYWERRTAPTW